MSPINKKKGPIVEEKFMGRPTCKWTRRGRAGHAHVCIEVRHKSTMPTQYYRVSTYDVSSYIKASWEHFLSNMTLLP